MTRGDAKQVKAELESRKRRTGLDLVVRVARAWARGWQTFVSVSGRSPNYLAGPHVTK